MFSFIMQDEGCNVALKDILNQYKIAIILIFQKLYFRIKKFYSWTDWTEIDGRKRSYHDNVLDIELY